MRAMNELLKAIEGQVLRYCRSRLAGVGSVETANDVTQEVLYAVCDARPRYRPETHGSVMKFVFGIARIKVVDEFRAATRRRSIPAEIVPDLPAADPGPDSASALPAGADRLRWALARLTPAHRDEGAGVREAGSGLGQEAADLLGPAVGDALVDHHRGGSEGAQRRVRVRRRGSSRPVTAARPPGAGPGPRCPPRP